MEIGGVLVGQGRGARRTKPKKGTVIGEVSKKGSRVPAGFGMLASTPEKATEATVLLPAAAPKPMSSVPTFAVPIALLGEEQRYGCVTAVFWVKSERESSVVVLPMPSVTRVRGCTRTRQYDCTRLSVTRVWSPCEGPF